MDICTYLRIQARANRLANHRLHGSMAALPPAEFHAERTGFFPCLALTLNHILAVDQYYIGALYREPGLREQYARFQPAATVRELATRQQASDERLIDFCDRLDAAACDGEVAMERSGGRVQRDAVGHVLAHLFMHQTHHRGQAHAMLSATPVPPPQLDEFLMPSEPELRVRDMAALGWDEAAIYGRPS